MKNAEYVIRIMTRTGRAWKYLKERGRWKQVSPTGRVRRMTAEQLLSHLLPPLAGDQPAVMVRFEHRRGRKK